MKTRSISIWSFCLIFLCALSAHAAEPYAYTQPAWAVQSDRATLAGSVLPGPANCQARFEWQEMPTLSPAPTWAPNVTAWETINAGNTVVRVKTPLGPPNTTLGSGKIYQYRLMVRKSDGTLVEGNKRLFMTGARLKAWGHNGFGQTTLPSSLGLVGGLGNISCPRNLSLAWDVVGALKFWGSIPSGASTLQNRANVVGAGSGQYNSSLSLRLGLVTREIWYGRRIPPRIEATAFGNGSALRTYQKPTASG